MKAARSTRRASATLIGGHLDLDDRASDGLNDTCSWTDHTIPEGDQVWWSPTSERGESERLCRRHAFAYLRWPQSYTRGVRRARPWAGIDLLMLR